MMSLCLELKSIFRVAQYKIIKFNQRMNPQFRKLRNEIKEQVANDLKTFRTQMRQQIFGCNRQHSREQARVRELISKINHQISQLKRSDTLNLSKIKDVQEVLLNQSNAKYQNLQNKIKILNERINQLTQQLKDEESTFASQLRQFQSQFTCKYKKQEAQVKSLNESLLSIQSSSEEISKYKNQSLVDPRSKQIKKFKIVKDEIKLVEEQQQKVYQLMGKVPISEKPLNKFTIISSKSRFIDFGIVDKNHTGNKISTKNLKKGSIRYDTLFGTVYKYDMRYCDGQPSDVGQTVVMRVQGQKISWQNEGVVRASCIDKSIGDGSIEWIPYIQMCQKGDHIRWE